MTSLQVKCANSIWENHSKGKTMDVAILAFDNCTALGPIGPMEILFKTNPLYNEIKGYNDDTQFFNIKLVGVKNKSVRTANGFPILCDALYHEIDRCDLIVVPAVDNDIVEKIEENREVIPWLKKMYDKGAELSSICTGAFMIAETGLLNQKYATTHWTAVELFKQRYPQIRMKPQNIIVDEGRITMSGGATAFLNLMIYLIEKFCGKEIAIFASKVFLIDVNKGPQDSYSIFSVQKSHNDAAILEAQSFIERNLHRRVSVAEVAKATAISKRNFIRRFKKATGNTPIEYIQRVKVEQVKKALEMGYNSIENLIREIGYEDIDSFRKVFKKITGISPIEYRKKYQLVPN